jgi:serine/threonine protein kinase
VIDNWIVGLYDHFQSSGVTVLVLELLGRNRYEIRRGAAIRPATLGVYARDILTALAFRHSRGFVHCDIKLENCLVLLNSSHVKLIDFNTSCHVREEFLDYIQSRFYRAPGVILERPYGPPLDIWSFGCLLAEMVTGELLSLVRMRMSRSDYTWI